MRAMAEIRRLTVQQLPTPISVIPSPMVDTSYLPFAVWSVCTDFGKPGLKLADNLTELT